jgi:hypothetical protein
MTRVSDASNNPETPIEPLENLLMTHTFVGLLLEQYHHYMHCQKFETFGILS